MMMENNRRTLGLREDWAAIPYILASWLGQEYIKYRERTKRLLPYLF